MCILLKLYYAKFDVSGLFCSKVIEEKPLGGRVDPPPLVKEGLKATEGKNQTLVGAIPFCGEYPGPRFEDKFRSANQIDGISIADGGKMADS